MRRPVTVAASVSLSPLASPLPLPLPLQFGPLARWVLLGTLAAATAGCGQPGEQGFSSTLETPANPGDGYSLVRVADSEHLIEHIAVTGDYLFFSMFWHGVYAMPRYGGDVTPVDTDTSAEDIALAASPSDVVWIKARFDANDIPNEQLRRRAASGAPITNLKQGNLHAFSSSLAENLQVTATEVMFLGEGFVEATPLAGGASTRVTFPWSDDPTVNGAVSFQADDAGMFLLTCPIGPLCRTDCGAAPVCTLSQGDPVTGQSSALGMEAAGTTAVALDEQALYLTDGRRLWMRSRVDGTEVELFAAAPEGGLLTAPLAADADHLYIVAYGAPTGGAPAVNLLAIPKTPGAPATIGTDGRLAHGVWDMTVDDQFVFVLAAGGSNDLGNEVLAFPKTPPPSP